MALQDDKGSRDNKLRTIPAAVPQASNVIYYSNNTSTVELPCLVDEEPLDVEMEERWAEDEELMMDVDMTTELQQEVYQQVLYLCCYGNMLLLVM